MSWCPDVLCDSSGAHRSTLPRFTVYPHNSSSTRVETFLSGLLWISKIAIFGPQRSNAYCLWGGWSQRGCCYVTVCVFLREA